jgi:hypothetical protein
MQKHIAARWWTIKLELTSDTRLSPHATQIDTLESVLSARRACAVCALPLVCCLHFGSGGVGAADSFAQLIHVLCSPPLLFYLVICVHPGP